MNERGKAPLLFQAGIVRRLRRAAMPIAPKPAIIIAQVAGSGTV